MGFNELIIKVENGRTDTITREFYYLRGKLAQVNEKINQDSSYYYIQFDVDGRCILIDGNTSAGPGLKHEIKYFKNKDYGVEHGVYVNDQISKSITYLNFENTDSMRIYGDRRGNEICRMRQSNGTVYVDQTWYDDRRDTLEHQIVEYDKNNRKVSLTRTKKGAVNRVIRFTYDKYGNELSLITEDVDNAGIVAISKPDTYHSTYEYDSHGNWTSKKRKNETGDFQETVTRDFSYEK